MTPKRAQEIIQVAVDQSEIGPWADQLDKVMTEAESKQVNDVWDRMPGNTSLVDALYKIARMSSPGWKPKTNGS